MIVFKLREPLPAEWEKEEENDQTPGEGRILRNTKKYFSKYLSENLLWQFARSLACDKTSISETSEKWKQNKKKMTKNKEELKTLKKKP